VNCPLEADVAFAQRPFADMGSVSLYPKMFLKQYYPVVIAIKQCFTLLF
jgi:hypothetical protein